MGGNWSRVLCDGWQTPVSQVVHNQDEPRAQEETQSGDNYFTLRALYEFAMSYAKNVDRDGNVPFIYTAIKSFIASSDVHVGVTFTVEQFVNKCLVVVIDAIIARAKQCVPTVVYDGLMKSLNAIIERLGKEAAHPFIRKFFQSIKFIGVAKEGSKAIVKASGKAVTKEGAKAVAKASSITLAKQAAVNAAKVSVVVDGVVLSVTVVYSGYKCYKGQISGKEFRRITIRRSGAAVGSIGLSAAGAFLGTLIMPGIGTFIGGFIGGMIGDYAGSHVGAKIDDRILESERRRRIKSS